MTAFGPEDPHDRETVGAMLAAVGLTVREVSPAGEGGEAVYVAHVVEPPREVVCKVARAADADAFLVEPHLLAFVAANTEVPVPRVVGVVDDHPDLPTPFFVTERCDGESVPDSDDLSEKALGRVAHQAGDHLADLHASLRTDDYGAVTIADGDLASTGFADTWREWFECLATRPLDPLLDGRFADLAPALRETIESRLGLLDGSFDPVLTHDDYRTGNLLLDPDSGEIDCVVDWDGAITAPAEYDLVETEQLLCNWAPLASARRDLVRRGLYRGYETRSPLPWQSAGGEDEAFQARRDLYLLGTHVEALRWFPYWHADADPETRERRAADHRALVRDLLDR